MEPLQRRRPRSSVNRALLYLQPIAIHQFGKPAVARLVDENMNRIAVYGKARPEQKKISQMSAQNQHSLTFVQGRVEVLAADHGNRGAELMIRRIQRDGDL